MARMRSVVYVAAQLVESAGIASKAFHPQALMRRLCAAGVAKASAKHVLLSISIAAPLLAPCRALGLWTPF